MPEQSIPSVRDFVEYPLVVLGCLLLSGALGGALVGLLAGSTLALASGSWATWGGGSVLLGSWLGLIAGPLVPAVTAAIVLRSSAAGPRIRAVTVLVPTLSALALSLAVLHRLTVAGPVQLAVVPTAVVMTGVVAAGTSRWCLAPLVAVRRGRRTGTQQDWRDGGPTAG